MFVILQVNDNKYHTISLWHGKNEYPFRFYIQSLRILYKIDLTIIDLLCTWYQSILRSNIPNNSWLDIGLILTEFLSQKKEFIAQI